MQASLLTKEQMLKLTTKRLLAYKNKLMKYHSTQDYDSNEICKSSPGWIETYNNLKEILSIREHIERK